MMTMIKRTLKKHLDLPALLLKKMPAKSPMTLCYMSYFVFSDQTNYYPTHACASRGLCGWGWCPCIYMFVVNLNRLSNQFTLSNICGRTSHRIYRPALPLLSPETLSLSSKSRIFLHNAHLLLFVWMDDTITHTSVSVSIVI